MTTADLPGAVAPGWQTYLRPLGPDALGPFELVLRSGARVDRYWAERAALFDWAGSQAPVVRERVYGLLQNLDRRSDAPWAASSSRRLVMGILNVTPDSFSDGGDFSSAEMAIAHGRRLIEEGADIIDVGGESTRPGALAPPFDVERDRVLPVIAALAPLGRTISIDTRRAAIMQCALEAGATMINDVSALGHDPGSLTLAASCDVPVVLMHMQGTPETMQRAPHYLAAPFDVFDELEARIATCEAAGVARTRLIVDPGIGFGKSLAHNLELLRDLALFRALGCPVMVGVSRKGFLGQLSGTRSPKERLPASLAAALFAAGEGVDIVRVHDVAATRQALAVQAALTGSKNASNSVAEVAAERK